MAASSAPATRRSIHVDPVLAEAAAKLDAMSCADSSNSSFRRSVTSCRRRNGSVYSQQPQPKLASSKEEVDRMLPYVPQAYEIYVLVFMGLLPFVLAFLALLPMLIEE